MRSNLARILYWIGDQIERGVSDDWPLSRFGRACFTISQRIYASAFKYGSHA